MESYAVKNLIVSWLKNYAETHNIKVFVVGVSGGIDSALTSTLCTMTGINTIAVSIPIHPNVKEISRIQDHMKFLSKSYLNIEFEMIDLTKFFEEFKNTIPLKFQDNLSLANTRARIRMTTLYQIASKKRGIVVGTGNKVEDFGIGFFTKYGDGGVDISPIADLTKSEVKQLAESCGIITQILNAEPTDGLWDDGRTDEDQIGATYKDLEWAMNYHGDTELTNKEKEVLNIYRNLHRKNKHKMTLPPICLIPKELKS